MHTHAYCVHMYIHSYTANTCTRGHILHTHRYTHTQKKCLIILKYFCYPLACAVKLAIFFKTEQTLVFSRLCQKRLKLKIVASCSECPIPVCLVIFYDVLIAILNILNKLKSRMKTLQQRLVFCFVF